MKMGLDGVPRRAIAPQVGMMVMVALGQGYAPATLAKVERPPGLCPRLVVALVVSAEGLARGTRLVVHPADVAPREVVRGGRVEPYQWEI